MQHAEGDGERLKGSGLLSLTTSFPPRGNQQVNNPKRCRQSAFAESIGFRGASAVCRTLGVLLTVKLRLVCLNQWFTNGFQIATSSRRRDVPIAEKSAVNRLAVLMRQPRGNNESFKRTPNRSRRDNRCIRCLRRHISHPSRVKAR